MTTPVYVIKQADQSRFYTAAALSDDSELVLALTAGSYLIDMAVAYRHQDTYATAMKAAWEYSGTISRASVRYYDKDCVLAPYEIHNYDGSTVGGVVTYNSLPSGISTSSYTSNSAARGFLRAGGALAVSDSGNLKFRWGNDSVSGLGGAVTVYAGSYIVATPVCDFL